MHTRLVATLAAIAALVAVTLLVRMVAAPTLGPLDGHDLAPTQLDRVSVGDVAPDFALRSLDGGVVRLSDYRGSHRVVLVFYRGHW